MPIVNPIYDRDIAFDAPVDYDTGLVEYPVRTKAQIRLELLRRLGYSAQVSNPPPGMNDLLDSFIQSAQDELYWQFSWPRLTMYFQTAMIIGQAVYDIPLNGVDFLEFRRVESVHLQNGSQFSPMNPGIDASLYTTTNTGIPSRYEFRSGMEVWPAPSSTAYTVHCKGYAGLRRFTEDTDKCMIDFRLVLLWALATAKSHYGQPDAPRVEGQVERLRRRLNGLAHINKRLIPGGDQTAGMIVRPVKVGN